MTSLSKLDMLTRVEGHGSVDLIQVDGRVVDARLNLEESPRLFEALLVGRRFDEIADIACRICSICSTVHKVAALQAVELAMGVTVTRQTALLRELAVQGGQIESHALHIFCLALPDYLGMNSFQDLATHAPEILKRGLAIKYLGNRIQEVVGGRAIHPFNLVVGGVGTVPGVDRLRNLGGQLAEVRNDVAASMSYVFQLHSILPQLASLPTCAVSGGPPLFGDHLSHSHSGRIPAHRAIEWLNERIEPHTHAKVSCFDDEGSYMVGPLARLMSGMPQQFTAYFTDTSIRSSLKARVVELNLAVERSLAVIEQLIDSGLNSEVPVAVNPKQGDGVSLIEAPRGVLLHSYRFDTQGICRTATIITPTAINQKALATSLKNLIEAMDGAGYAEIKTAVEVLVRCYDPCISCAVH